MHKRGRTNDFPKNGGSLDAMDDFLGESSSNVIIFGGVEIKLVDFGRSVVHFIKNGWGALKNLLKNSKMGEAHKKIINALRFTKAKSVLFIGKLRNPPYKYYFLLK